MGSCSAIELLTPVSDRNSRSDLASFWKVCTKTPNIREGDGEPGVYVIFGLMIKLNFVFMC